MVLKQTGSSGGDGLGGSGQIGSGPDNDLGSIGGDLSTGPDGLGGPGSLGGVTPSGPGVDVDGGQSDGLSIINCRGDLQHRGSILASYQAAPIRIQAPLRFFIFTAKFVDSIEIEPIQC